MDDAKGLALPEVAVEDAIPVLEEWKEHQPLSIQLSANAVLKSHAAQAARIKELEMENSGLESALAGEKAAREHDRSVRWALPENLVDGCPEDIRALGWAVAVHNDYQLDGVNHTFWLFTKSDRCTKGEGLTDAEALNEVRAALRAAGE